MGCRREGMDGDKGRSTKDTSRNRQNGRDSPLCHRKGCDSSRDCRQHCDSKRMSTPARRVFNKSRFKKTSNTIHKRIAQTQENAATPPRSRHFVTDAHLFLAALPYLHQIVHVVAVTVDGLRLSERGLRVPPSGVLGQTMQRKADPPS